MKNKQASLIATLGLMIIILGAVGANQPTTPRRIVIVVIQALFAVAIGYNIAKSRKNS